MTVHHDHHGERLLPLAEVEKKVGFKSAKIYRLRRAGTFPEGRIVYGKRLWLESELDEWIRKAWQQAG